MTKTRCRNQAPGDLSPHAHQDTAASAPHCIKTSHTPTQARATQSVDANQPRDLETSHDLSVDALLGMDRVVLLMAAEALSA